jgi:hypothetical protein
VHIGELHFLLDTFLSVAKAAILNMKTSLQVAFESFDGFFLFPMGDGF